MTTSRVFDTVETVLASAVAAGGTFTFAYPDGRNSGSYTNAVGHKAYALGADLAAPGDFTLTFNSSNITFTLGSGRTTIPAGSPVRITIERKGENDGVPSLGSTKRAVWASGVLVSLGAPIAADDDNLIDAATSTEVPNAETVSYTPATDGTSPTDNGSVVSIDTFNGDLCWVLDVPRNIISTVTHGSSVVAMTITVHGYDEYGVAMTESIAVAATGTSQSDAGLKAFKYVKQIDLVAAGNAEANTVNVGFGDVFGLPVFLPATGYVLKELEDGAAPTAGTVVAGAAATATATTGDVRGTYDPNSAADGSASFELVLALPDPSYRGITQYAA